MDRRGFLTTGMKKAESVSSSTSQRMLATGINPYNGPWTINEISHLLKRTMFGAKKSDVDYFAGKTMSQAVDELINPVQPMPSPPLKAYVDDNIPAGDPEYTVAPGTTWVNTYTADGTAQSRRRASFRSWWIGVMINQDRSIREKMTLFWHNHFATEANDVGNAMYVYKHHDLLRKNALGNFKSQVGEITIDPCMLSYLNGQLNTKTAPDENYSRELQELFTLGKENNPNYTEDDVKTAARVLTGWRNDGPNNKSYFDPNRHDVNNKTFSPFFGNAVIAGRTGATAGDLELDDFMNMIFAKNLEVSRFIVKKLYRWFVYYQIDSTTEQNVIGPLAKIFRDNNWEIKPVLSVLFKSEHFFDIQNQGCQIKSPIDFTVGLCREFNVVLPGNNDLVAQYNHWNNIRNVAANLQQAIGDPPDVSGWKAYYQEPSFYEIWINSDTYPKRNQFTDQMLYNGFTINAIKAVIDSVGFTKTLSNPADPNALINDVINILYRNSLSQATRDQIKKDILLTGQVTDNYWTSAWTAHVSNPADTIAYNLVNDRLKALYKYLMNLAEYHLA
jgi:uncharacterized protein (DUF1800 family)